MPERRTSSVTSFMSSLRFSGKVIMGSILFGFGLLLVGAILLIIATGGQKSPPLRENEDEKKTPMIYVGPGVMGVGSFFVIVGTIMCLFETRILRRRKNTDHESLVRSEILPTGNASPSRTENQGGLKNVEERQVKTVSTECHTPTENLVKSSEKKTPVDVSEKGKDCDRQLSTSTHSFNVSIYVEAVGENDSDADDNEEHFTSGSIQFSTPPESEVPDLSKIPLDDQSDKGHDFVPEPTGTPVIEEDGKGSSLLLQQKNENRKAVSEGNGNSIPVPEDNEVPLPVSSDSIPAAVSADINVNDVVLTKAVASHPVHVPDSTEELEQNGNTAKQEQPKDGSQVIPSSGLPDT